MNNLDKSYQSLLQDILDNGVKKETRNGGTLSVFGRQIRHNMKDGFPLLTTKKMAWKTMVTELLWFLRGDTNIKYLVDNDCHIWDGDAYKRYVDSDEVRWPKSKEAGVRRIEYGIDQIANLIRDLKTNPDSRRLMVNAYNIGELDTMVLPPCHYGFQCYTRELSLEERYELMKKLDNWVSVHYKEPKTMEYMDKHNIPTRAISLMWVQRSVDSALGWPYNVSSYSLLLMMLAKQVNMVPDEVICSLGDCHIYLNHIDGVKEQLTRESYPLPNVRLSERAVNDISEYTLDDIVLENYQSHPKIYFPLSN